MKDGTLVNQQYNQWKAKNGVVNNIFTHSVSGSCREERKCVVFGNVITITRIYWMSFGKNQMTLAFETNTNDFFYFEVEIDQSLNLTLKKQMICYNGNAGSNDLQNMRKEEIGDDQKSERQTTTHTPFSPSAPSVDEIAAKNRVSSGKRTMESIVVKEFGDLLEATKNTSLSSDQMLKAKQLIELKKAMK